jgi:hypothetical protein
MADTFSDELFETAMNDVIDLSSTFINETIQLENAALHKEEMARLSILTARNATASPLLRLPGEIRNKIYAYALDNVEYQLFKEVPRFTAPQQAYVIARTTKPTRRPLRHLALLGVCRQIHHEAELLPFHLTKLHITSLASFRYFSAFTPKQRAAITKMHLCLTWHDTLHRWNELFKGDFEGRMLADLMLGVRTVVLHLHEPSDYAGLAWGWSGEFGEGFREVLEFYLKGDGEVQVETTVYRTRFC